MPVIDSHHRLHIAKPPYDAEVEYLECRDTTSYILTPMMFKDIPVSIVSVSFSIAPDGVYTNRGIMGAHVSTNNGYFTLWTGGSALGFSLGGNARSNFVDPIKKDVIYNVTLDSVNDRVLLNGDAVSLAATKTLQYRWNNDVNAQWKNSTTQLRLFRSYFNTITGLRIHSSSCSLNGIQLYDYIPVRVGDTGYMYDRVSKQLIANYGTFILGPDKSHSFYDSKIYIPTIYKYTAKDYVQDGLVAMWDGIENDGWGKHNSELTSWKNLIGSDFPDLPIVTNGLVTDDAIQAKEVGSVAENSFVIRNIELGCIECCFAPLQLPGYGSNNCICVFGQTLKWMGNVSLTAGMSIYNAYGNWYVGISNSRVGQNASFSTNKKTTISVSDTSTYQNGQILDSVSRAFYYGTTTDIVFGSSRKSTSSAGYLYQSKAAFHNVRVYSRDLTAEEIAHNYVVDSIRFQMNDIANT